DVVMAEPIPDKGKVLTQISNFWFEKFRDLTANHVLSTTAEGWLTDADDLVQVKDRALVCKICKPLPVEAIVRGYLVGSGWKEYQKSGTVCEIPLPKGLRQAEKLPHPLFTPSTKAEQGAHDENISPEKAAELMGADVAKKVSETAIKLYEAGAAWAAGRGILLADTKFEFGIQDGTVILIDEVMTPDSSRFWPMDGYAIGSNPPSFDKQFVRDWLEAAGWNKNPPPPALPQDIVDKTRAKYIEAYEKITGKAWTF
ncbi:MAG TPA: phosphoribosylaminoimidazolesuccinocarboxamide synthase, partial [bacterium]|nr:phosphoribosylaminoimidazolesuccinocarboxamide synthase [bacterium]